VVIRVPIQTGQKVSASDALMVLEAMKMETVIASHCDGKISAIHARAGDAVQVEQVLIEFE
jgi:biotin carboxyl carrier protein